MSVAGTNASMMMKALKDMLVQWEATGNAWHDHARVEFDEKFLQQIVPAVRQASIAAQEIENLLQKVRADVT